MNENTERDMNQGAGQQPNQGAVPPNDPHQQQSHQQQTRGCVFDSLCDAADRGAKQARKAAEEAIPKVKAAASGAAYWFSFGVAYAVVFSAVAVKELAPAVFVSGGRDGAKAGRASAEKFAARFQSGKAESSPAATPEAGPTSPQPESGAA